MSRFVFNLPELGDGIAEAELMRWLVQPGEEVTSHQPIVEVQTDKALIELTSPTTGVLLNYGAEEGTVIAMGSCVAVFDVPNGAHASPETTAQPTQPIRTDKDTSPPAAVLSPTANPPRPLAAPTVRRLATEMGISLASVPGTGPGGRILREDVESYARPAVLVAAPHSTANSEPKRENTPVLHTHADENAQQRIPLRGLRRAIARQMTQTLRTVPHVTGLIEIDVTELSGVLERLRPTAAASGIRLTWSALFALATLQALKEFPQLNAYLDDEREEIVLHKHVHLGIATATADGLLVPVVRNADSLSLIELAAGIDRASAAARDRSATPNDLSGSTFTITNYGAVGGWYGTPMVNHPEIGIVGFGTVAERPAVVNGELAVRTMVALSHTVDHRLIDGAVNAQFGSAIRRRLEQPDLLLLGAHHGDG